MIKYRINVVPEERMELLAKVLKGKATVKSVQKAQVLLASDETVERQSETDIAAAYYLSIRSVERIRQDFCERGMAVGAEEAKRYLDRLEFVYTPKHSSWLDMAEPGGRSH